MESGGNMAEDFPAVVQRLERNDPSLTKLKFEGKSIGAEGARALAEGLKHNYYLEKLDLDGNGIGAEGARALAEGLKHNSSLEKLKLKDNEIGAEGARALAEGLKHNSSLEKLDLHGNLIGDEGARALAEGLKHNSSLKKLSLLGFFIGDEGARALAEGLKHNSSLEKLDLHDNHVGDEGAEALAEGLKHNSSLKKLDLGYNSIRADGAWALAEGLKHLKALSLWGNFIGDEGARDLAESLKHNSSLQELDLGWNEIGAEGARALAEGLKHNSSLKELDLESNEIGAEGARALAEGLKHNSSLKELDLGSNEIGDEGARALAEGLKHNSSLRELYLYGNSIGNEGAWALAEGLKHNSSLKELEFGGTGVGSQMKNEINALLADQNRRAATSATPHGHLERGVETMGLDDQASSIPAALGGPANGAGHKRRREHHHSLQELTVEKLRSCMGSRIGTGGFGSVYRGELEGAQVAIKILEAEESMRGREEYEAEVQMLATLRHPCVVQIFAKCDEERALVMELMEGGTLQDRLDNDSVPWYDCVRVLHEAAVGLRFLHNQAQPVLHRDIKPSNVLLTSDLRGKLSDMGLAKRLDGGATRLTTASVLTGTIYYLCPEYQSRGQYKAACDVYALGVMIAVSVCKEKSPAGIGRTLMEAKEDDQLPDLVDDRPGTQGWDKEVAVELLLLAIKCTKGRMDRRPSMEEIVAILTALKDRAASSAPSASRTMDSMRRILECPITYEVMQDPLQAEDGHTYEREAIETHFRIRQCSPMTNLPMGTRLTPNHAVKSMVAVWVEMGGMAGHS